MPDEGRAPGFEGASGWLNSAPLTADELRGKVVLVDFWTYTCINWLRTLGYVRSWAEKYKHQGLVVVGVHTPEFPFERDTDNVSIAAKDLGVTYPIALDSNYAVWSAFDNHYWPAAYIADVEGRIRHHQFGEGGYEECERIIQRLLDEAGHDDVSDDFVAVADAGFEAQADWTNLGSPETYLGHQQGRNFASPGGVGLGVPRAYVAPDRLKLNSWALSGEWTVESRESVLTQSGGGIAYRFHARDVNLVLGSEGSASVPFRVHVDGRPPGPSQGLDVDENGDGELIASRLYQLVRQHGPIVDSTFEITFLAGAVEAYAFTFG